MMWGIGGIFGYSTFGFIADWIGRRRTVALYNVGTLVLGLTLFLAFEPWCPTVLPVITASSCSAYFPVMLVYTPAELFPTHVRSTAVAFCNGTARVITSFVRLVAGLLAAPFGGQFQLAVTAIMTCFAILSIYAMHRLRDPERSLAALSHAPRRHAHQRAGQRRRRTPDRPE